jgi:aspartate carbamoyltransferase
MIGKERNIRVSKEIAYKPEAIAGDFRRKHILSVEQFERGDVDKIFRDALMLKQGEAQEDEEFMLEHRRHIKKICEGYYMAEMFYEPSTRTDMSFQNAMLRLGGSVAIPSNGVHFSSVYKGENLRDTMCAIGCYVDVVILRHPELGSALRAAKALDFLRWKTGSRTTLISGGDGIGEHPTQALLDLFTIEEKKGEKEEIDITMVGDLKHGRTVHSLSKLLCVNGFSNVHINFVSPESLRIPREVVDRINSRGISTFETDNLHSVIGSTDVIYWTRVQEERFPDKHDYEAIKDSFVMTPELLNMAKEDAILMHPFPRKDEMGTEEDHEILDADRRSVYHEEMQNGMFVRMAVIANVLGRM